MFKCGRLPRDMKNLVVLVTLLWLSYSEGCLPYRIRLGSRADSMAAFLYDLPNYLLSVLLHGSAAFRNFVIPYVLQPQPR